MLLKGFALVLVGATLVSAPLKPASWTLAPARALPPDTLAQVTLRIEGMTCGGCAIATRKVLTRLAGVARADVSYEEKQAVVTYAPAKVTVPQMIAAVKTLNYTASVARTQ